MRINKWVLSGLLAIFVSSSMLASPGVLASSLKNMQEEKKSLEQKKSELDSGIKKKESEIKENDSTIESLLEQIRALNNKVEETNRNIDRVEAEIAHTTDEIETLQGSILELETRIAERDVVLRDRVRAMQVTGGSVNYLDVLLGANSFSDFIDRFSAVTTLLEADRKIMKQQAEDIEQLEEEKLLVEQKLAEQEENKSELEGLKSSLESQKSEKDKLINRIEAEQEKLSNEKENLEATYEETHEMTQELEQEILSEQKRVAEIARKAAEEQQRAAAANKSNGSSGSTYTPSISPSVSSGAWTRPAAGRLTSQFGWRKHPTLGIQRQHRGIDVANGVGTSILAAGDGVVSRAAWHSTYGNLIMITHSVNGQTYTTVYAHLSSLGVSAGQHVSKGQLIGKMGSTGNSTGSHLHFEFHVGYYSGSGPSAKNPLSYVPF